MVQEEKIASFYYAQYKENAIHKGKNRGRNGNKSGRLDICRKQCTMLGRELNGLTHTHVKAARLEDFHRQIKNIAAVAFHKNDPVLMMKLRDQLIPTLVKAELCNMSSDRKELVTEKFLGFLRAEKPFWICTHSLDSLCADYSKFEIKEEIMGLVPERPEMEFPEALQKKRHFILHAGPTNCGKTYHALECLKQAEKGIYLGPLRLLALEVYEKMSELLPCSMVTGEESIVQPESRVISATVEMLDTSQEYDIAVIDEAQMIEDPERGHSWTRAILGIRADEIHICMSEDAIPVITHLISLCHDTYRIERYHRTGVRRRTVFFSGRCQTWGCPYCIYQKSGAGYCRKTGKRRNVSQCHLWKPAATDPQKTSASVYGKRDGCDCIYGCHRYGIESSGTPDCVYADG